MDCSSSSVVCRCFVLAVGLITDRAGRLWFFRSPRLLAGRGSALIISGFVVWSRKLAGHPFGFLVFMVFVALRVFVVSRILAVFLDGGLMSLSRAGGWRHGGWRHGWQLAA